MHARSMLDSHPRSGQVATDAVDRLLHALADCAQTCTTCADACVAEENPKLMRCIRLDLDCAAICTATAQVLSRATEPTHELIASLLETCELACRLCAQECEKHASMHEHCRICAETCRSCEEACRESALVPA